MRRNEEINPPFKMEPNDFKFISRSKINFNPIVEYNIIHNCHPVDMHPESLRGRYTSLVSGLASGLKTLRPKSSKIPQWYQQYTDSITNPNQWILTFERLFLEYVVPKAPIDSYATDYQCVLVDSATNAMQAIAHFYSLFELDNTFRQNSVPLATQDEPKPIKYIFSKDEISPIDFAETRSYKPNEYLVPNQTYHSVVHAIRNGDPKAKISLNTDEPNSPESIRLTAKNGLSQETSSNEGPIYDMNGIVDACWCTFQENDLNVLLNRAPFVVVSLGPNKPFGWLGLNRGAVIIFRKDIHIEFSKNHKFAVNDMNGVREIMSAHDYFNQNGRSSYDCFIYSWLKRYTHNGRDSGKYVKDDILLAKEHRIKRFWRKGHTERYFSTYGIRANLTPEAIKPAVTKLLKVLQGKEGEEPKRPKGHQYANINTIFNPDEYFPFIDE